MIYSIYDPMTGQILFTVMSDNAPAENYVEGSFNDKEHYVDVATKTVINKPEQSSINSDWNFDTRSWELNISRESTTQRLQRDQLLSAIDRINPIWYASLTQEQQTELSTYRQSLLDVPQQAGFPVTIEWPTKPSWL